MYGVGVDVEVGDVFDGECVCWNVGVIVYVVLVFGFEGCGGGEYW